MLITHCFCYFGSFGYLTTLLHDSHLGYSNSLVVRALHCKLSGCRLNLSPTYVCWMFPRKSPLSHISCVTSAKAEQTNQLWWLFWSSFCGNKHNNRHRVGFKVMILLRWFQFFLYYGCWFNNDSFMFYYDFIIIQLWQCVSHRFLNLCWFCINRLFFVFISN